MTGSLLYVSNSLSYAWQKHSFLKLRLWQASKEQMSQVPLVTRAEFVSVAMTESAGEYHERLRTVQSFQYPYTSATQAVFNSDLSKPAWKKCVISSSSFE